MRLVIVFVAFALLWISAGCDCFSQHEYKIPSNPSLSQDTAPEAAESQVRKILSDLAQHFKLEPIAPKVIVAHSFVEFRSEHGEAGILGRRIGQDVFVDATLWNPGCNPFIQHRFGVLLDHLKDALKQTFKDRAIEVPAGEQHALEIVPQ